MQEVYPVVSMLLVSIKYTFQHHPSFQRLCNQEFIEEKHFINQQVLSREF
jgi:hypothetical protein